MVGFGHDVLKGRTLPISHPRDWRPAWNYDVVAGRLHVACWALRVKLHNQHCHNNTRIALITS
jgi:hypothetical protein